VKSNHVIPISPGPPDQSKRPTAHKILIGNALREFQQRVFANHEKVIQ
jgi:hypothetical protein